MKKRIIAVILAVITTLSLFVLPISAVRVSNSGINATKNFIEYENAQKMIDDMSYVMTSENGMFKLYIDDSYKNYKDAYGDIAKDKKREPIEISPTYTMAIENTITGEVTFTNPYNSSKVFSTDPEIGRHLSQIYINYFKITSGKNSMSTLYSYNDCFSLGQGKVYKTDTGVSVDYSIGEEEKRFAVPLKISLEDLHGALTTGEHAMSDLDAQEFIKENFTVYDPYQKYIDDWLIVGSMVDEIIKEEPMSATIPFVYLPVGTYNSSAKKKIIEDELKEVNPEYFRLSNPGEEPTQFEIDRKNATLWTAKDDETYKPLEYPNFKLTVDYDLTNEGLVATIDANSISYKKEEYCLSTITLLPYFDAASMIDGESDNGYVFLPDGSGTIIRFEDLKAKGKLGALTGTLYGTDFSYYQITDKNTEQYTMPVFGLVNSSRNNGTGYFAIIEDGDALATITANAERSFMSAYASFKYADYDTYDIDASLTGNASKQTAITVVSKNYYEGAYKVNYKLLMAEETAKEFGIEGTYDTTYIGMAELYRDYLTKNGSISKIEDPQENVKLFLEMFGSTKVKKQILSFPVTVDEKLTTFQNIIDIQKELSNQGISNTSYILKGFYNGGLSATYPTKIKWQRVLGGKKGLNALLADAKDNGYEVSIDVDLSYAYATKNFSGYSNKKYAVKTLDNRYTTRRVYYAATQTFERTSGVAVSSASFIDLFEKFEKSVRKYDLVSLATRTLGSDLNSDFDKEAYYTREDSKENVVALLKYMARENDGYNLILDVGNNYSMPYADGIVSAPLDNSRFVMESEAVPFYGMVYHGSVEFAGNALNMEGDESFMLLRALENGAVLYYTLAYDNIEALKFDKEYSKYYSVSYEFLKDSIVSTYETYNTLMKDKQNKYIIDHEFLNDEDEGVEVSFKDGTRLNNSLVVLVVYEGGEGFILNYNSEEINLTMDGKSDTIGGLGYLEYSVAEEGGNVNG